MQGVTTYARSWPESEGRSDRITKSDYCVTCRNLIRSFELKDNGDVTTRSRVEKADAPRGLSLGLLLPSSRTVQCTFSYLKANTFTLTREFAASVPSLLLSSADSQIACCAPPRSTDELAAIADPSSPAIQTMAPTTGHHVKEIS